MSRIKIQVGLEGEEGPKHSFFYDTASDQEAESLRQTCGLLRAEIRALKEQLASKPPWDGVSSYQHQQAMNSLRMENDGLCKRLKQMGEAADLEFHRRKAVKKDNEILKARIEDLQRDLQQSSDMLKKIEDIITPF